MKRAYRTIAQPGRRKFIQGVSAAAVAGLGAPYIWAQGKTDDTLVVNSFGGEYQELVEKAVIQPFEKKFGVKVVHDTTGTRADTPHAFVELEQPRRARYVRVTSGSMPFGGHFAVSGLRPLQ